MTTEREAAEWTAAKLFQFMAAFMGLFSFIMLYGGQYKTASYLLGMSLFSLSYGLSPRAFIGALRGEKHKARNISLLLILLSVILLSLPLIWEGMLNEVA